MHRSRTHTWKVSVGVTLAVAAGALVPFAPAAQAALPTTTVGAWKFSSVAGGDPAAIDHTGRYVVTEGGVWADTLTGDTANVGHLPPGTYVSGPRIDYMPGQSPDLATSVAVAALVSSAPNGETQYTDTIGGTSAQPTGASWKQQLFNDVWATGCFPGNKPEILGSTTAGVIARIYSCDIDPLDQDNGRTDTYLWHPDTHTFELISVAPADLPAGAGYSSLATGSWDGTHFIYYSAEDSRVNPGQWPYGNAWYMWNRTTNTRVRFPDQPLANVTLVDSATGPYALLTDFNGNVSRYDEATGTTTPFVLPPLPAGVPAYADQSQVGVFSDNGRFYLVSLFSGSQPCCTTNQSLVLFDLVNNTGSLVLADTQSIPWGHQTFPKFIDDTGTRGIFSSGQTIGGIGSGTYVFSANGPVAPGAPTGATAAGGNQTISVGFQAPASNGGSPVTGYNATCTASGHPTITATGSTSPIVVTGAVNGNTYVCQVTATNTAGTSGPSNTATATLAIVVAGPPSGVTAFGYESAIRVTWPQGTSSGTPITGYHIRCVSPTGVVKAIGTGANSLATTIVGVTNGTTYQCSVATKNSAGTGTYSSNVPATPLAVPGAPTLAPVTATPGAATLTFTPSEVNGTDATFTAVCASPGHTSGTSAGTASPLTITGLDNTFTYQCTVTASNSVGAGLPSSTRSVTPRTVADPPTSVTATNGPGAGQVTVTWTAPLFDGGWPISGYTTRCTSGGVVKTVTTDETTSSAVITGSVSGSTYDCTVVTRTTAGSSAASNSAVITAA